MKYKEGYIAPSNITLLSRIDKKKGTFKCFCGNTFIAHISNIARLHTNSCGCRTKSLRSIGVQKHGGTINGVWSSNYSTWQQIKKRLFSKSYKYQSRYALRGITMYEPRINNFNLFDERIEKNIGEKPSNIYSLDRIDNNGNYEPGNLRRATSKEQANNRSNMVFYNVGTESYTLSDWAIKILINKGTLASRIYDYGMTMEQAIEYYKLKKKGIYKLH